MKSLKAVVLVLVGVLAALVFVPTAGAQEEPRFDVLVFSKTTGFRHADAIDAGKVDDRRDGRVEHDFAVTA